MRRVNRKQLLERLWDFLHSPELRVRKGRLRKEHGQAYYHRSDETKAITAMRIVIDPRNAPTVSILIHELLHLYLAIHYEFDLLFAEPLEEVMVEALTTKLTGYLHDVKHEKLLQKWIKALEERLSLNAPA